MKVYFLRGLSFKYITLFIELSHYSLMELYSLSSFPSIAHSPLDFPISTAGHHSAHFIHIINKLHLSSSQSLMKMLNNSKPNSHPLGPTGHFPLISCITFHLPYVLWLQISCRFWIHVTFHPVLFELISCMRIREMFYQVLIQVQTYRKLHYIQIFPQKRLIEYSLFLINCTFLMYLFPIVFPP